MNGFKSKLKRVLSDAVSNFQKSGDPNAACIKAANDAGLSDDQADRLVETFNTARAICNYKYAQDKTDCCSLADKEVVRAGLSRSSKAEKKAEYEEADYSCYSHDDCDYFVSATKVAKSIPSTSLDDGELSQNDRDYLALRRSRTIAQLAKSAEDEARVARCSADKMLKRVADGISRNASIDAVHEKVASIVAAYAMDDRYSAAVEKLAEFLPPSSDPPGELLMKYSSMHVVDTSCVDEYVPAIKEAADLLAEAAAMDAYSASLPAIDTSVKSAQTATNEQYNAAKIEDMRKRLEIDSRLADAKIQQLGSKGESGGKSNGLASVPKGLAVYLTGALKDGLRSSDDSAISEASDRLKNFQRQLILQDLIMRDKILSQEDPNTVVSAFRSLHQISPDSTLNKEITRSMLRNVVKSVAISPYDAKTLVDLDKSRRQTYTKAPDGTDGGNDE